MTSADTIPKLASLGIIAAEAKVNHFTSIELIHKISEAQAVAA